jgi:hypothetical protein
VPPIPENLAKFYQVKNGLIVPPDDIMAAQKAFGPSDIFLARDSTSGIKYEDNQGTAGPFTVVGTNPQDFFPGP